MWKLVRAQCYIIVKKKEFFFAFLIMILCVLFNHFHNIYVYYGSEIAEMISFPEISLLGGNKIASFFFLKFYPFLLVLPAGFSLANDKTSSMKLLWTQRIGRS